MDGFKETKWCLVCCSRLVVLPYMAHVSDVSSVVTSSQLTCPLFETLVPGLAEVRIPGTDRA